VGGRRAGPGKARRALAAGLGSGDLLGQARDDPQPGDPVAQFLQPALGGGETLVGGLLSVARAAPVARSASAAGPLAKPPQRRHLVSETSEVGVKAIDPGPELGEGRVLARHAILEGGCAPSEQGQ
jgi:hypothetical protein